MDQIMILFLIVLCSSLAQAQDCVVNFPQFDYSGEIKQVQSESEKTIFCSKILHITQL